MKIRPYCFLIFSFVLFNLSCRQQEDTVVSTGNMNNTLMVDFSDTTTYCFISSFINNLNLKAMYIIADSNFQMELQVDSGNVSDYVTILSNDSSVIRADSISQITGKLIIVEFHGNYSVQSSQYAKNLFTPLHGLTFIQFIVHRQAIIEVPDNNLQKWIDLLKTYPFVTNVVLPACGSC